MKQSIRCLVILAFSVLSISAVSHNPYEIGIGRMEELAAQMDAAAVNATSLKNMVPESSEYFRGQADGHKKDALMIRAQIAEMRASADASNRRR